MGRRAPVRACARAAGGPVKPAALARDPGAARSLGGSVCLSVRGCHHGGRGQSGAPGLRSYHPVPAAHVREGAHPGMSRRHPLPRPAPCSVAAALGAWRSAPAFRASSPLRCCSFPAASSFPLGTASTARGSSSTVRGPFPGLAPCQAGRPDPFPAANCRPALPVLVAL